LCGVVLCCVVLCCVVLCCVVLCCVVLCCVVLLHMRNNVPWLLNLFDGTFRKHYKDENH
jgi:hypothetical protein